jgi:hypothetical protein
MTEPVVVGADGSQPAERAAVWAAVSSRMLHSSPCPVVIVGRPVALATTSVGHDVGLAGQS